MTKTIDVNMVPNDNKDVSSVASVINTAMGSSSSIIVELLRTAAANPIVAAATMIIITDILARTGQVRDPLTNKITKEGVISQDAADKIGLFIGALTAINVVEGTMKSSVQTLAYGTDAATLATTLLPLLSGV